MKRKKVKITMPSISKIRFTNVIYEDGNKRYNDELFRFDGHNAAILLENGGGKTVFIQTVIQAILPHTDLADRKLKHTLKLEDSPAHIAIEWILSERPRRYALTCISLFLSKHIADSHRYVYEYGENDNHSIEHLPFVKEYSGKQRAADKGEISEYYQYMSQNYINAKTFPTLKEYRSYIEQQYHIIPKEWDSIIKINSVEGGVENYFDECKTTGQLFDRLLIPTIEESMAGNQKGTFVETFEKHRESFKQYKQLKEKITENEKIKLEMNSFVQIYEQLHVKEQSYLKIKRNAKGYMTIIQKQQTDTAQEQLKLNESREQWEGENSRHQQRKASYEIAVEEDNLQVLNQEHQTAYDQVEASLYQLSELEKQYYSLKVADYRKKVELEEENQLNYKLKLEELDQEVDSEDLRHRLDQNSAEVKGHYEHQIISLTKKEHDLQYEVNALDTQTGHAKRNHQKHLDHKLELDRQFSINEDRANRYDEELQIIASQVLSNIQQEKVVEEFPKWSARYDELDQASVKLSQENKLLEKNKTDFYQQIDTIQQHILKISTKQSNLVQEQEQFEESHNTIKLKLGEMRPIWSRMDSVYLKQDSIEKQLMEIIYRLETEREKLLYKERLAHRFVDDYGTQDIFYADPFIAQILDSWRNQFSYLETGMKYMQSLDRDSQRLFDIHPMWPISLIVTAKEKAKLLDKLDQITDRLQYPIQVLTTDEANSLITNGQVQGKDWIHPLHWKQSIIEEEFTAWKKSIADQANIAKETRIEKDIEITEWKQLQRDLNIFIKEYRYEDLQQIEDDLQKFKNEIFQIKEKLELLTKKVNEVELTLVNQRQMILDHQGEMSNLTLKLDKAQRYIMLEKNRVKMVKEGEHLAEELKKANVHIIRENQLLIDLISQTKQALNERQEILLQKNIISNDRLFKEVQEFSSTSTTKSIEWLERERDELKLDLNRISKGRGEIQAYIQNAQNNLLQYNKEIETILSERDVIDETVEFPFNGEEKMRALLQSRKKEEISLKDLRDLEASMKEKKIAKETEVQLKKDQYIKRFREESILSFHEALPVINEQIMKAESLLAEQDKHIQIAQEQLGNSIQQLDFVFTLFDKYDPKHQFMSLAITSSMQSTEEILEFTYNRDRVLKEVIQQLESQLTEVINEKKKVEKVKNQFKDFCRREISDYKMKEMALQGIDHKQSYEDLIEFRKHMENRINLAIQYAEHSIRSHDKQLEYYIVHIYNHLKKITDELKLIPKKTRVKVENHWKEIYSFSIPDLSEQDSKEEIRQHIEWILEQLEREKYEAENGNEDAGKVRKDIQIWLQTQQLLRVVLKSQTMKVNCRKVTNDNQISTRSYTWEQSNVWSGGEKWSKNMTLFLGLLNYIAEKRQHIQPKLKLHRTVIVDNPFGKASSDHVLSPVFFIAEQLGFQIIALTAHTEGKFLRDYFPIIYSCRLRNTAGSDKQVITKEKTIQYAFFQDHAPQSLERLGEVEQLELF